MPSATTLTIMQARVMRLGIGRVKPSAYFMPTAQPISNRPATTSTAQANDDDADIARLQEYWRGRPRRIVRNREAVLASLEIGMPAGKSTRYGKGARSATLTPARL